MVKNKISKEYNIGHPLLEPRLNNKGLWFWVKRGAPIFSMPTINFGIPKILEKGVGMRKGSCISYAKRLFKEFKKKISWCHLSFQT